MRTVRIEVPLATEEFLMRGRPNPQRSMLAIVDLEERIPQDHPLRRIKEWPMRPWHGCHRCSTAILRVWA